MTLTSSLRPAASGYAAVNRDLPAWPILVLLWGYPLWWGTGMLPFSGILMSLPMLWFLVFNRRTVVVPGVLPWLAFVLWMLPCMVMLDSAGRMLGYSIRLGQFTALALTLIYVVNARKSLTPRRLMAGLSAVWVTVIVGGYLGMLWPEQRLSFTVGRLLPAAILSNDYVSDLVFPPFAEIQDPWGAAQPFLRPSAPFAYTNGWGAAMAMLTPVVIGFALWLGTRRALVWTLVGILAAVPPAAASTNRGMFLTLGVSIGYVLLRMLFRRQWKPLIVSALVGTVALIALSQMGLFAGIAERQDTVDTTEGRGNLYTEAFLRTLQSPILGYGAPRPSFTSEITVGTQGALWNAMFCFGLVGLALFLWFLVGAALRTWSAPGTALLWVHSAMIGTCFMCVFYGLDRQMLFFVVISGLMLRERFTPGSEFWKPKQKALSR